MAAPDLLHSISSLKDFLNPEVFNNTDIVQEISRHLVGGRLVIIKSALKDSFAEKIFNCLDEFSEWHLYEDYSKQFHYRHHNLYEDRLFPADLIWCSRIFESDSTKSFIQQLSREDCSGPAQFSASWYQPGDYSLPHNDFVGAEDGRRRRVAFIWHLTKNWQPSWGGDLFWCPAGEYLSPSFNTLFLFVVRKRNLHFVTTVSPYAQSKRLAINGWWTGFVDELELTKQDGEKLKTNHPLLSII